MLRYVGVLGAVLILAPIPVGAQTESLCTGVGEDARTEAAAFKHTLKLVYAATSGNYIGDVAINVSRGNEAVYEGTCDGPWMLLNLAPGTYKVTSTFEGQTKTMTVQVGRKRLERTTVFRAAD